MLRRIAMVSVALAMATTANAQRAGTIEAGVFGHFTSLDEDINLGSSSVGLGARLGFFAFRQLSLEAEYSVGTVEENNIRDVSMWLPFRGLVVGHIGITPRVKLILGAGYKADTWQGDTTANEFEDAFTAIGGLRICLNSGWSVRPEVVFDHNPSPNNQVPVTSTSTHIGFRIGISKFFGRANDTCLSPEGAMAVPPPPPPATPPAAAAPPPPPPPPAPTVTLSAAPTSVAAGASTMLIWSSNNATRCSAPWTTTTTSSGSQQVSPTQTTTYTITCTGAGGSASAPATVTVAAAAAPPPAAAPREIFRLEGVYFDFDQATIKPEGRVRLDSAVTVLNRYADLRVEIQGHTDSIGTDAYNQGLSMRRANAVREYLTSRGIAASRLTTRGFGETQPIADNATDEGRAQNRRVVLVEIRN